MVLILYKKSQNSTQNSVSPACVRAAAQWNLMYTPWAVKGINCCSISQHRYSVFFGHNFKKNLIWKFPTLSFSEIFSVFLKICSVFLKFSQYFLKILQFFPKCSSLCCLFKQFHTKEYEIKQKTAFIGQNWRKMLLKRAKNTSKT